MSSDRPNAPPSTAASATPRPGPTPWPDAAQCATNTAELYWLTTVRPDGRPHVTPLIARVQRWSECTSAPGCREQKARNLERGADVVALTTGQQQPGRVGLDVVVEGTASPRRRTVSALPGPLAEAYETKYGSAWHFDVGRTSAPIDAIPATDEAARRQAPPTWFTAASGT